ncbi:hypothetical protein BKA81DRAFT_119775 [Phyllosticta paracitricarpa]|uniref:Secreted protein n=1 Tax=Phyllosticta paracitricarpa TaxID=2016321 RepID=A0ABR1MZ42_9PEZI
MILTLATYVLLPYLRCARAPQGFGMLSAPVVAEVLMSTRARTPRCPFCGGQVRWFPVCLQVHTDGLLEARCASSLSHLFRFADERASKLVSEQQQQQRLGNSHVGIMYLDLHRSSSSLSSSSSTHTHTHPRVRTYVETVRCGGGIHNRGAARGQRREKWFAPVAYPQINLLAMLASDLTYLDHSPGNPATAKAKGYKKFPLIDDAAAAAAATSKGKRVT